MLWVTLLNKIGKQPLSFTQHNHVYALLYNEQLGRMEQVAMDVKYDAKGRPYLCKAVDKNT